MRYFFLLTCLAFSFLTTVRAQQIDAIIEKYGTTYGQERIYLHNDKSTYAPGETIWFKAYVMQGIYPATESKNIYIDWTDESGKLLLHSVGPIVDGTSAGQLDIPADYTGKFLHIKAYTKWMLNFDSAFLYNSDIRILSKSNIASRNIVPVVPRIEFFPESGELVANLKNKVAFKASDQYGRPVKVQGGVFNKSGKQVDNLSIVHDGMGYITVSPSETDMFTAKWKDEKGKQFTTDLPLVKPSGVVLHVLQTDSTRSFQVMSSQKSSSVSKINIIGTMYQHPVFKVLKDFSAGEAKGVVPIKDLPTGILTITVLDDNFNPLAERITYIDNKEYLFTPEMEVQHWGLNKRARNEIQISVPDDIAANLSISVTDLEIGTDSSDNIISHLLLSGELRGRVYQPSWYFSNTGDSVSEALDLVMLTNGWRRFNWGDLAQGKLPEIKYPKDTSYITLSGKIYGALPSQLREAQNIFLFVTNKVDGKKMIVAPIEPSGSFNDPSYLVFDTANVYYQLANANSAGALSVKFLETRLPPLSGNISATGNYYNRFFDTAGNARQLQLANELAELAKKYEGKVLEAVTIKLSTKSPKEVLEEKYASGLFRGGDGYQFDLINDPRAVGSFNIFNYLQGQVAGLQINSSSNPPSLQWRGGAPQLYIDELPADASMVSNIPLTDVAFIKVMRPPFMGGAGGGGASGAIAIYTRRGDDVKPEPGKGLPNSTITGYNPIREFYSPNYGTISPDDDKQDLRTTLYWNPNVLLSPGQNKSVLTFYNTDVTKGFRVIIEGITKDGRLAHVEQLME
ncbi:MAG: hypothetical protein ABIR19_05575 [Ginsengibacter sp.]